MVVLFKKNIVCVAGLTEKPVCSLCFWKLNSFLDCILLLEYPLMIWGFGVFSVN